MFFNREESSNLMRHLLSERASEDFIRSTLLDLSKRIPSSEEMLGYLDGLLELAVPLRSIVAVDLCGTGGDQKGTFNISTAAAFVLAGMDVPVAKHGNSAASSKCGSSDVLKALGVNLPSSPEEVDAQMKRANLVFLHAPFFHPALARIAPIRKQLGVKTIFNFLGPIANPVRPSFQLIGVADPRLMEIYAEVLSEIKRDYVIVHSKGGYDEISMTAESELATGGFTTKIDPEDFELDFEVLPEDLLGGETAEENAEIILSILSAKGSPPQNAVVAANAAVAAKLYYPEESYNGLFSKAQDAIHSKAALTKLELSLK